ncbi:histidinol dehydrogenase [Ruminococcaceae bacterium OttesenSCG-928-I18]|nr:histidinol dehydrogenase [Ruminococcaceae bacterium OttesenSCG-928-I18]
MIEIRETNQVNPAEVLRRRACEEKEVDGAVASILTAVREKGDEALFAFTETFDGAKLDNLSVPAEEVAAAREAVGKEFLSVLEQAARNIRAFHEKQVRQGFVLAERPGVVMGQRVLPLEKVGVYVPGGTAAYPSTVLMDVIPAKIAGVEDVVMVTPPDKEGKVSPAILAAASVAGVDNIFRVGGAQAVAALAWGTQSLPRVDKIVGPGNIYVATAKKMVYGQVDIDMIAGPSDILVLADETAQAPVVAADMLGQAEHDTMAASVLVTTSKALAKEVRRELEHQLPCLSRKEIAKASLENNGMILLAPDIKMAVAFANALAPEHLEVCTEEPFALLPLLKNAGSIFLGSHTPEALGDYFAGPNHTLPTGGTARFYSPLSVDDFTKKSSYLYYSKEALQKDAQQVQAFALREGLDAHAKSVAIRVRDTEEPVG